MRLRDFFPRLTTGAYILNSGLSKRGADPETAEGLHGMASGAYPALETVDPPQFAKALSTAEIVVGTVLLVPFIPSGLAGAVLTAFSGGLVGLYLRTPGMREEGSLRPTPQGIGLAKDFWMLGIGLGMLAEALTTDE